MGARSKDIMNEEVFAIVIWALLWATILAPFAFRKVLNMYAAENPETLRDIVKGESSACDVIKIDEAKMAQHENSHRWSQVARRFHGCLSCANYVPKLTRHRLRNQNAILALDRLQNTGDDSYPGGRRCRT